MNERIVELENKLMEIRSDAVQLSSNLNTVLRRFDHTHTRLMGEYRHAIARVARMAEEKTNV